jgi:hypothetical protein
VTQRSTVTSVSVAERGNRRRHEQPRRCRPGGSGAGPRWTGARQVRQIDFGALPTRARRDRGAAAEAREQRLACRGSWQTGRRARPSQTYSRLPGCPVERRPRPSSSRRLAQKLSCFADPQEHGGTRCQVHCCRLTSATVKVRFPTLPLQPAAPYICPPIARGFYHSWRLPVNQGRLADARRLPSALAALSSPSLLLATPPIGPGAEPGDIPSWSQATARVPSGGGDSAPRLAGPLRNSGSTYRAPDLDALRLGRRRALPLELGSLFPSASGRGLETAPPRGVQRPASGSLPTRPYAETACLLTARAVLEAPSDASTGECARPRSDS